MSIEPDRQPPRTADDAEAVITNNADEGHNYPAEKRPLRGSHSETEIRTKIPSSEIKPHDTLSYDAAKAVKGWRTTRDALLAQDEAMLKGYQDDIDALLLFAGLFSAVLTSFVVQIYQNLQQDNSEITNMLLHQISQQLAGSNDTSVATIPSFEADQSDLRVNTVWFVSLVLSLTSALVGIFAKQWLRSYITWKDLSPAPSALRVRQYRYEAMIRWKLPLVIVALPGFLQAALILFFIGLLDFSLQLNPTLGVVLSIIIGLSLLAVILFTIMPLFSLTAPYRSPWSTDLARLPYLFTRVLYEVVSVFELISAIVEIIYLCADPFFAVVCFIPVLPVKCLDWLLQQIKKRTSWDERQTYIYQMSSEQACPTWNHIDELQVTSSGANKSSSQNSQQPSLQAASLNALLSSADDADALLLEALPCAFRYKHDLTETWDTSGWSLHIADCVHIAGWFFGQRSADTNQANLLQQAWGGESVVALSPTTRRALQQLLSQAIAHYNLLTSTSDTIQTPDFKYVIEALRIWGHVLLFPSMDPTYDSALASRDFFDLCIYLLIKDESMTELYENEHWNVSSHRLDALCIAFTSLQPAVMTSEDIYARLKVFRRTCGNTTRLSNLSARCGLLKACKRGREARGARLKSQLEPLDKIWTTVGAHHLLTAFLMCLTHFNLSDNLIEARHYLMRLHDVLVECYADFDTEFALKFLDPEFWKAVSTLSSSQNRHMLCAPSADDFYQMQDFEQLIRTVCAIAHGTMYGKSAFYDSLILGPLPGERVEPAHSMLHMNVIWNTLQACSAWLSSRDEWQAGEESMNLGSQQDRPPPISAVQHSGTPAMVSAPHVVIDMQRGVSGFRTLLRRNSRRDQHTPSDLNTTEERM